MSSFMERAAKNHLEMMIEFLVDDPYGFGSRDDIKEGMVYCQKLAKELNESFDDLFKDHLEDEDDLSYAMKRFLELEKSFGLNWSGRNL